MGLCQLYRKPSGKPTYQAYQADCTVEHQIKDPNTGETAWTHFESMNITVDSLEHLHERAYLYAGRPKPHKNITAIRLTGTVTLQNQELDALGGSRNTVIMQIHILKEASQENA